jgi:hypothetical protein
MDSQIDWNKLTVCPHRPHCRSATSPATDVAGEGTLAETSLFQFVYSFYDREIY